MSSVFQGDAASREAREPGLVSALVGDGRPAIMLLAVCLVLSGGFAVFQSFTGYLLPHDEAYLGQSAAELCAVAGCRIVGFIFHDRVAFGGALVAAGTLYAWLTVFPLARRERWALRTLVASAGAGFASILAFLGTGYLDTWHTTATVLLVPAFALGVACLSASATAATPAVGLRVPGTAAGVGRALLLATGAGIAVAGAAVLAVGSSVVFVPQDIAYIGLGHAELRDISPRLVPLIAHDRAGFGGALLATGIALTGILWHAPLSRGLWQALVVVGIAGFGAAIGVHAVVGYHDATHVGPAVLAAAAYAAGLLLTVPARTLRT